MTYPFSRPLRDRALPRLARTCVTIMHTSDDPYRPNDPLRRAVRPQTAIAWMIVTLTVLVILILPRLLPSSTAEAATDRISLALMRMQGMYMVGVADADISPPAMLLSQAEDMLNTGSIDQRSAYVILAGELGGTTEAASALAKLNEDLARAPSRDRITEAHERLITILHQIYLDPNAPRSTFAPDDNRSAALDRLTDDDRDFLVERLGWFGKLALHPEGAGDASVRDDLLRRARQAAFTLIGFAVLVVTAGGAGLVLFILAVVFAAQRSLRWRFALPRGAHGIYAETFAVWLLLFIGLQFAPVPAAVIFIGSLAALAWPVMRGVSWSDVRADIGLTGRGGVLNAALAVPAYLATLPILCVGLLMTLALMQLASYASGPGEAFEPNAGPAHPVVDAIASGSAGQIAGIFLLAAVAAPIVEEIMFRGVLYAHLRGATKHTQRVASVMLATAVNTFIFAVIHPQGFVAVPVLMSLAIGFTLAREWRGSVVTPIVMHGINNGIVVAFATLMLQA